MVSYIHQPDGDYTMTNMTLSKAALAVQIKNGCRIVRVRFQTNAGFMSQATYDYKTFDKSIDVGSLVVVTVRQDSQVNRFKVARVVEVDCIPDYNTSYEVRSIVSNITADAEAYEDQHKKEVAIDSALEAKRYERQAAEFLQSMDLTEEDLTAALGFTSTGDMVEDKRGDN